MSTGHRSITCSPSTVEGHGRIDVGGEHADEVAHCGSGADFGAERGVFVGAEPDLGAVDAREAVVEAERRASEDRGLGAEKIVGGLADHRGGRGIARERRHNWKCRKNGAVGVVEHSKFSTRSSDRFPGRSGSEETARGVLKNRTILRHPCVVRRDVPVRFGSARW
jgi:hypothetical protein